jgi:hypothetical protein
VQVDKVSQLSDWQRDYARFNETQIDLLARASQAAGAEAAR